jgi:hypothetical protein
MLQYGRLIALLPVFLCASALAATPMEDSLKKAGFKRLSGEQIRLTFSDKRFTDQVHFAEVYKTDGTIQGMSMGKKHTNKWVTLKDQLCVTDNVGEICYAVWKKGEAVRLVVGDSDISLDGFVR